MQENASVLIATILAVIIIVLFPIYNIATRQDSISKNMVVKATTNFVDDIRNKGYIEADDYYKFLDEIHRTGNSYDVELEVYKPVFIETEDPNTYEEKYLIEYTSTIMNKFKASEIPVESEEDEIIEVSEDITNTVLDKNIYYLNEGYKFYVRVKNTNITQAQVLLDRLLRGKITERIVVNYGGVVYTNEWTKGEDALTSNANMSISRPMDKEGNEYKYEVIADVFDPYTEEYNTIYGIAVRLSEVTANEEINFILTYEEIEQIEGKESDREEHIKAYFEPVGFTADETVKEVEEPVQNSDGTWNYIYLIKLTNIQYDFDNNPYLNATVKVRSGSADTKTGMLGTLNSEEFVLFYDMAVPEIELISSALIEDVEIINEDGTTTIKRVMDSGYHIRKINSGGAYPNVGIQKVTFTAKGIIESVTKKIDKVVIDVKNINTDGEVKLKKTFELEVDENNKATTENLTLYTGDVIVTAYAIDSTNQVSEKAILEFKVEPIVRSMSGELTRSNRDRDSSSDRISRWSVRAPENSVLIGGEFDIQLGRYHLNNMLKKEYDTFLIRYQHAGKATTYESTYNINENTKINNFAGKSENNYSIIYSFAKICKDGGTTAGGHNWCDEITYNSKHWDDFKISYTVRYVNVVRFDD